MSFEFLEHTADVKFRAFGKSLSEAFESSVLAFSSFVSRGEKVSAKKRKSISILGDDRENLFYNFLEELIGLLDEGFVVSRAKVEIRGLNLKAILFGDDVVNYKGLDHVKAATYSEMFVGRWGDGPVGSKMGRGKSERLWMVQAVLDV